MPLKTSRPPTVGIKTGKDFKDCIIHPLAYQVVSNLLISIKTEVFNEVAHYLSLNIILIKDD